LNRPRKAKCEIRVKDEGEKGEKKDEERAKAQNFENVLVDLAPYAYNPL
jgi:hypothetical protein